MSVYRSFNIQIKGRVQDIGFRNLVENIGKSLNLRGMVYNDVDGSVKIVCSGAVSSVKALLKELRDKSVNVGAVIDEVDQEEIPGKVDFPPLFFKAPSDEFGDFGRKLDVGVVSIQGIERNTGALLENPGELLENTGALLENSGALLENTGMLLENSGRLLKSSDAILDGQGRQELILKDISGSLRQIVKKL